MFQRIINQGLVLAFSLSVTGFAFARNPPALMKQQHVAAHTGKSSAGYRDINWRFGTVAGRAPEVVRAAGGYRDIYYRFGHAKQPL